jgi:multidrug efflux pump subunit AcrB
VPTNAIVTDVKDLEGVPLRAGTFPAVHVGDVAKVVDGSDIITSYALSNGRRTVYIPVTKRADASTLSVVNEVKANLAKFQAALPDDVKVSYEFDQSGFVTRAITSLTLEGLLGAVLTGIMVLLFLRDRRAALIVVINIPLALLAASLALWLTGATVNLMSLGGMALAVGILVDSSTVTMENIHAQMAGVKRWRARYPIGARGGGAAADRAAVRSRGICALAVHAGRGAGALRAANAGGGLCDDRLLAA